MLPKFKLVRPDQMTSAIAAMSDGGVAYCGGTELLLAMRAGLRQPEVLVDLKGIDELRGIRVDGDLVVVGAATSHSVLARSEIIRRVLPSISMMERRVGNARVRAQGTVGGNLSFAEPKSDLLTLFSCLDARVVVIGPTSNRESSSLSNFIIGPYEPALASDQLLFEVAIPWRGVERVIYDKFQTRERPSVGVAAVAWVDHITLAVGAVCDSVQIWNFDSPEGIAVDELVDDVDIAGELGMSEEYLRHVISVLLSRAKVKLNGGS